MKDTITWVRRVLRGKRCNEPYRMGTYERVRGYRNPALQEHYLAHLDDVKCTRRIWHRYIPGTMHYDRDSGRRWLCDGATP